jgi:plasmid stability protein
MTTMTIRKVDEQLKKRLRVRAASHGRSMEDEAREILRAALSTDAGAPRNLAAAIRARVTPLGGLTLDIPPREPLREPTDFGG